MELVLNNISVRYGSKMALDSVSCSMSSGGLIGLIGPNGAGKSTLMKLIATLAKPSSGDILLDGKSIVKHPSKMRKTLGYLPQDVAMYPNLSAREFLEYMAAAKGMAKKAAKGQVDALLSQLHLTETGKKPLSSFSGGMRQRVGIAATLLGDPYVIVVDEPTTGLDPQERVSLRSMLSELAESRIVLLSTHIVSDIEAAASSIILLKEGKVLYSGAPEEMLVKAVGKVWEYTLSKGEVPAKNLPISALVQTANGVHVRVVSEERPATDAKAVTPSLEDACLAALRGGEAV